MASSSFPVVPVLVLFLALFSHTIHSHSHANGNSFGIIRNLEGSKKGQKVYGLPQLRNYLAQFGYLHASEANLVSSQDEELFDEGLESAIKTYQLNYNLPVTGYLDTDTVKLMTKPRCGFPDIINGTNTMYRPHKPYTSRKLSINGTSLYVFMGTVWPSNKHHLTYRYLAETGVGENTDKMPSIIEEALGKWAQVSVFTFESVPENGVSDLVFGFYKYDHGDGLPFDGTGGVWAHAFRPQDGRAHFDSTENWSLDPDSSQTDLPSVVVHEIGHLLGMAHTPDTSAVMYAFIELGQVKRDLTTDDIQGIQALYPTS